MQYSPCLDTVVGGVACGGFRWWRWCRLNREALLPGAVWQDLGGDDELIVLNWFVKRKMNVKQVTSYPLMLLKEFRSTHVPFKEPAVTKVVLCCSWNGIERLFVNKCNVSIISRKYIFEVVFYLKMT